jgi:hypothetical protein
LAQAAKFTQSGLSPLGRERLIEDGVVERVCDATTVGEIFNALNNRGKYIAFSDGFLAMQLAYDLANSDITRSGEDDFWSIRGGNVYGDGMKFCFGRSSRLPTQMTFKSWRKSCGDSGKNRTVVLKFSVIHPFGSSDAAARDKASDQYRRFRNRAGAT